jgi:hypothetical protein
MYAKRKENFVFLQQQKEGEISIFPPKYTTQTLRRQKILNSVSKLLVLTTFKVLNFELTNVRINVTGKMPGGDGGFLRDIGTTYQFVLASLTRRSQSLNPLSYS